MNIFECLELRLNNHHNVEYIYKLLEDLHFKMLNIYYLQDSCGIFRMMVGLETFMNAVLKT